MTKKPAPKECPVCGATLSPDARACPECGADERTGWNEEATRYDGLELPDSVFDLEKENPRLRRDGIAPTGVPYFSWIVAALMLAVFLALVIYGLY